MGVRHILGAALLTAAPILSAAPPVAPAPAPAGASAAAELPASLADFRFITALTITERQSPLYGFHHFYANTKAWEVVAKEGLFPFPRGSVFVDLVHDVHVDGSQFNESSPRAVLVMQKDASARETGGWRFATYRPDGTLVQQDVKSACFECHIRAKARDYVFSKISDLQRQDLERNKPKKK